MEKSFHWMMIFDKDKMIGYYAARTKEELVRKLQEIERIRKHKVQVHFYEHKKVRIKKCKNAQDYNLQDGQ